MKHTRGESSWNPGRLLKGARFLLSLALLLSHPAPALAGEIGYIFVEQALKSGLTSGRNFLRVGDWELGIDTIGKIIYHAVYKP